MRTQEQWVQRNYPKFLQAFSPRLRRDITEYPMEKLPIFGSYYIYGPTSSGKSVMAAHMYLAAQKQKYFERLPGTYLFVNTYDFFSEIKSTYDDPEKDEAALLAKYSTVELLVLDDLGSTKFSEWASSILQILINNRYENLLHTIITCNLTVDDLAIALNDERTASRIRRMCKLIKVKG